MKPSLASNDSNIGMSNEINIGMKSKGTFKFEIDKNGVITAKSIPDRSIMK